LGGEDHGDVLLAQHLQPFADARGEDRVVEIDPGLVEDQQRRPAFLPCFRQAGEALLQPMEEIGLRSTGQRNDTIRPVAYGNRPHADLVAVDRPAAKNW
jgi:hypothetical protein